MFSSDFFDDILSFALSRIPTGLPARKMMQFNVVDETVMKKTLPFCMILLDDINLELAKRMINMEYTSMVLDTKEKIDAVCEDIVYMCEMSYQPGVYGQTVVYAAIMMGFDIWLESLWHYKLVDSDHYKLIFRVSAVHMCHLVPPTYLMDIWEEIEELESPYPPTPMFIEYPESKIFQLQNRSPSSFLAEHLRRADYNPMVCKLLILLNFCDSRTMFYIMKKCFMSKGCTPESAYKMAVAINNIEEDNLFSQDSQSKLNQYRYDILKIVHHHYPIVVDISEVINNSNSISPSLSLFIKRPEYGAYLKQHQPHRVYNCLYAMSQHLDEPYMPNDLPYWMKRVIYNEIFKDHGWISKLKEISDPACFDDKTLGTPTDLPAIDEEIDRMRGYLGVTKDNEMDPENPAAWWYFFDCNYKENKNPPTIF